MTATVKREKITPSRARKWLAEANQGNRKRREGIVSAYARDMASGQWIFTGDPIRFNGNGDLIDGQHRLSACIEANTGFDAVVIRGLESAAKSCIDTGAKRNLGDVLHYQGYKHTISLAATIRWCVMYERGMMTSYSHSRRVISISECLEWLGENQGIINSVKYIGSKNYKYTTTRCPLIAIHYYTTGEYPGEANAFIESVVTGANLKEKDPCFVLRRWLEWAYVRDGRLRSAKVIQAVAIKTWNAFIEGRQIRSLSFRVGGSNPESFPRIVGGPSGDPED